jgi:hypothetical protein
MPIRTDAQIIDAGGKFLIPGLWDMHSHPGLTPPHDPRMLRLFIANGITGTRVMQKYPYLPGWRDQISAGSLLGPSMSIASPSLDAFRESRDPDYPWRIVSSAEQARAAVRRSVQEGAEFIKVYDLLPREAYFAIANEAAQQRVPFVGHVPYQMTPAECSMAGQKSIEHVFGIERACDGGYETWRQAVVHAANPKQVPMLDVRTRLDAFERSRVAEMASVFRKNNTWLCPTLITSLALAGDATLASSANLKYVPREQQAAWAERVDSNPVLLRRLHERFVEIVSATHNAGVGILAGTDTPVAYCVPGFALHQELQLLVTAGLTPIEALRAATSHAAEFFGKADSRGTIEAGKLADLVLLDANPLQDIRNTQQIDMVITAGRAFRKPALEAMLQAVEAVASLSQPFRLNKD